MDFHGTRTTRFMVTVPAVATGVEGLHKLFSNMADPETDGYHARRFSPMDSPVKVLELYSRYAVAGYGNLFEKGMQRGENEKLVLVDAPSGLAMINFSRAEWQMNTVGWLDSPHNLEDITGFISEVPGLPEMLASYYVLGMQQIGIYNQAHLRKLGEGIPAFAAAWKADGERPEPAGLLPAPQRPAAVSAASGGRFRTIEGDGARTTANGGGTRANLTVVGAGQPGVS